MVHMIMEKIMRVTNAVGRMQSSVSGKVRKEHLVETSEYYTNHNTFV